MATVSSHALPLGPRTVTTVTVPTFLIISQTQFTVDCTGTYEGNDSEAISHLFSSECTLSARTPLLGPLLQLLSLLKMGDVECLMRETRSTCFVFSCSPPWTVLDPAINSLK